MMLRVTRDYGGQGLTFVVGRYTARLIWGGGSFFWREGDNRLVRFIRHWWSGWHRWDEE